MAWRADINTIIIINYHNFWLLYTLSGVLYIIEFKGVQTEVSKTSKIAKMANLHFRQSLSFFALFFVFFSKIESILCKNQIFGMRKIKTV